jgi:predicted Zn-dependent protease
MSLKKLFLLFLFFFLGFHAWAFPLSDEQEILIGERYAREIIGRYGLWHDPKWEAKISQIGRALVTYTHRNLPYRFFILNNNVVNAFALPGGFIFIDRGILPYFHNDNEVAAVLAHEISHVELDHFGKEYERAKLFSLSPLLLNVLTGGKTGPWARVGASISYNFFLNPHWSRQQETQADLHGVDLMAKAGFNPWGMVELFEELEAKGMGKPPFIPWMASHPDFPTRIAAIKTEIAKLGILPEQPSISMPGQASTEERPQKAHESPNRPL